MKSALTFLLLPLAAVFSLEGDAEEFNLNLQTKANIATLGADNHHQCYNHCKRHHNKSIDWKKQCMEECDDEYGPQPGWNGYCDGTPEPNCYEGGRPECCHENGGLSCPKDKPPCNVHHSGGTCGQPCQTDRDCTHGGGYIECATCGAYRGAQYYQQCYSDNNEEELELLEEDEDAPTWDDVKNGTKKAAQKSAEWSKNAANKTADAAKNGADKAADWGKKTFDPNSGCGDRSFALLVVVGSAVAAQALLS